MMDLMDEGHRERAERLLDHCAEAGLQFVRLMAATGAHMVSSGDSPAGPDLVSPRIYRTFALPWEKRLADEAHRLGLPYVLHICGRTDRILDDMLATGADGLELDYKTDARLAHERLRTGPCSSATSTRAACSRSGRPTSSRRRRGSCLPSSPTRRASS